jgi:hypothetical protein
MGPGRYHWGNPRSMVQLFAMSAPQYLCLFFLLGGYHCKNYVPHDLWETVESKNF